MLPFITLEDSPTPDAGPSGPEVPTRLCLWAEAQCLCGDCDQRYKSIEEKLESGKKRMEGIQTQLYIVIAAILFGPGVAADIVKKLLGL
jgi:hypothetical protein